MILRVTHCLSLYRSWFCVRPAQVCGLSAFVGRGTRPRVRSPLPTQRRPHLGSCGPPLCGHERSGAVLAGRGDRNGPRASVGRRRSGRPRDVSAAGARRRPEVGWRWTPGRGLGTRVPAPLHGRGPVPGGNGPSERVLLRLFSSASSPLDLVSPPLVPRSADCCGHRRQDAVTVFSQVKGTRTTFGGRRHRVSA